MGKINEKKMYKKGNKSGKKTRGESYSVLKKMTKNNNNNNNNKICKKWQFWKKKKNIWGKLKLDYQPAQFKKTNFDKDNFFNKYMGKHCSKTKTM